MNNKNSRILSISAIKEKNKLEKIRARCSDIVLIMENMCEEFEFTFANFYAISKNGEYISCDDQPHIVDYDEEAQAFLQTSIEETYSKGEGLLG